jgi:uncharacterized protein YxjI
MHVVARIGPDAKRLEPDEAISGIVGEISGVGRMHMNPAFQFNAYLLKRQVLALTGRFRIYDPTGNLLLFSEQKMFRLRDDIRVYGDEAKSQELLMIKSRQIMDFSAAFDVIDSASGQKVGGLRRKGWKSLLRDEWEVLDVNDAVVGQLIEDSLNRALLRRFLLGRLLPQNYHISLGSERVADLKQRFNIFSYQLDLDFSLDMARKLDRRLGLAAGILLAAIEGKQERSE